MDKEKAQLDELLGKLVKATAPSLLELHGVGVDTAATLLVTAGDNPERIRSEAAWAHLGQIGIGRGVGRSRDGVGQKLVDGGRAQPQAVVKSIQREFSDQLPHLLRGVRHFIPGRPRAVAGPCLNRHHQRRPHAAVHT